MAKNSPKPSENSVKRHNITMSEETRDRAEKLAELEKRSVSNLLAVLVDREWERLEQDKLQAEVEVA